MEIEIRVPEVGESVQEAVLAEWFVADGDAVEKDQPVFLLETDKITLEVPAEGDGTVRILVESGETVSAGDVVGKIVSGGAETSESAESGKPGGREEEAGAREKPKTGEAREKEGKEGEEEEEEETAQGERPARPAPVQEEAGEKEAAGGGEELSPSVRRLIEEHELDPGRISGTGPRGRLTKGDVLLFLEEREGKAGRPAAKKGEAAEEPRKVPRGEKEPQEEARGSGKPGTAGEEGQGVTRKPLSPIRRRIAERLLEAKRNTAMLTTFNEADMTAVMELRARHKSAFLAQHGVGLGITSFFVMAASRALRAFPQVNAFIEGNEIVYHDYVHMGIAIGAERGLVVPVIRHAERLGAGAIEKAIADFADKVRENKLELSDLEGGTFTITNGGVFGSLLSTPILNPPQSAILGLHKVEQRPVAVDGEVVVRSMMYLALSYDHRIIDGRDAVQFLVRVKELIETPERLWLEV